MMLDDGAHVIFLRHYDMLVYAIFAYDAAFFYGAELDDASDAADTRYVFIRCHIYHVADAVSAMLPYTVCSYA